jgi:hypothetical protein
MGVCGQRHAPAALCPEEKAPGTHCTGGWVGLRASLNTEVRVKILCPCRGSNPDRPDVQSVIYIYIGVLESSKFARLVGYQPVNGFERVYRLQLKMQMLF